MSKTSITMLTSILLIICLSADRIEGDILKIIEEGDKHDDRIIKKGDAVRIYTINDTVTKEGSENVHRVSFNRNDGVLRSIKILIKKLPDNYQETSKKDNITLRFERERDVSPVPDLETNENSLIQMYYLGKEIHNNFSYHIVIQDPVGQNLNDYLKTYKIIDLKAKVKIMRDMARALSNLHVNEIAFCNVFLKHYVFIGENKPLKLSNFGLVNKKRRVRRQWK